MRVDLARAALIVVAVGSPRDPPPAPSPSWPWSCRRSASGWWRRDGPRYCVSAVFGALLVTGSDLLGRTVLSGRLPVGIVTAILAPYLLYLLARHNRKVTAHDHRDWPDADHRGTAHLARPTGPPSCGSPTAGAEPEGGVRGTVVLDGLDLDVISGTVTAVVGPNGCGKSTLLRALGRLLPARRAGCCSTASASTKFPTGRVPECSVCCPRPRSHQRLTVADLVARGRRTNRGIASGPAMTRMSSPSAVDRHGGVRRPQRRLAVRRATAARLDLDGAGQRSAAAGAKARPPSST